MTSAKYNLKIAINGDPLRAKPIIINTCGSICKALIGELHNIPSSGTVRLEFSPNASVGSKVLITCGKEKIVLNEFMEKLILATILGYFSVLDEISADLMEKTVSIEFDLSGN